MHLYNLSCGEYGENTEFLLSHEQRFTANEFDDIVARCAADVLLVGAGYGRIEWAALIEPAAQRMVANEGFQRVTYTAALWVHASADLKQHNNDFGGEQMLRFAKTLRANLG